MKTKNRQKPWYRKSNGPIGNEEAVSRLGRLTTEVQKLYAGNANTLRFFDNEKDPERKEIKARQLIAAKRKETKERNSATATATAIGDVMNKPPEEGARAPITPTPPET